MDRQLTAEIAKALGLPKHTVRAVLTLDAEGPPRLELTVLATDAKGLLILEEVPRQHGDDVAARLAQVQFMVRLERFPEVGTG